ncbi:MAG TPA: hypothetical protein VGM63_14555 [Mucilaginibacter sp.]
MINPEDQIPLDDQEGEDKSDQQSQQDIHSNGLEEENISQPANQDAPIDLLDQSYRAADSAYLPGEKAGSDYRVQSKKRKRL